MPTQETGNIGAELAGLLESHGLRAIPELNEVLNLAWSAQLHRFGASQSGEQVDLNKVGLTRAPCLYAAFSLDSYTEKLLHSHGFNASRFVHDIQLDDFATSPSPVTIPSNVRASVYLVEAIERYASRFPDRDELDPLGLVYGCLATERGRFVEAIGKSGLDKSATLQALENRFDSEADTADRNASEDDTSQSTEPRQTTASQDPAQVESAAEDESEDTSNFGELLAKLSDIGDPRNQAQLLEGARQAVEYAYVVDMPIDNVLLFASLLLAPRRGEQQEESWFVVFNALSDQRENAAGPEDVVGLRNHHPGLKADGQRTVTRPTQDAAIREEVFLSVGDAVMLAGRVSKDKNRDIGVRHLLAALIWGSMPRVRLHLQNLGLDLAIVAGRLLKWLQASAPDNGEYPDAWAEFLGIHPASLTTGKSDAATESAGVAAATKDELPPPSSSIPTIDDTVGAHVAPRVRFAGFAADSADELDDLLGVEQDVNAICTILAARDVPLPLSLGLFGDWGSGKTFFMNMMHDRIEQLATSSLGKSREMTAYCDKVVQIRFNAWHYIDANLWASLVTYILDELYAAMKGKSDDLWDTAVKKLEGAQGLHEEAKYAHEQAVVSVQEAETVLKDARSNRLTRERALDAQFNALKTVLQDSSRTQLNRLIRNLGLDESVATLDELSDEIGVLKRRSEKLGGSLAIMARSRRAIPYFAVLLLIMLLPVGIGLLIPALTQQSGFAAEAGTFIGQIGTVVVGIAAWLRHPLKWIGKGLSGLEGIQEQAETARQAELDEADVNPEAELAVLREKEIAARENMRGAEKRLREAEVELKESQPSRRLYRLIEERAESEDYRSRLGIISLIRNDFEKLSDLIRPRPAKSGEQRAAGPKQDPLPIDRIVLYIDDLDRCPADRVVQVLEAVHLLLAFPIFVVVVAVDPRWLRRSLELTHPHLLTGLADEGKAPGNGRVSGTRAATPQNYLEKIFQVPFNLRPMGRVGYQQLIRKLVKERDDGAREGDDGRGRHEQAGKPKPEPENDDPSIKDRKVAPGVDETKDNKAGDKSPDAMKGPANETDKKTQSKKQVAGKTKKISAVKREKPGRKAESGDDSEAADAAVAQSELTESAGRADEPELNPPELELGGDEKQFMATLNLLFQTPRTVKRFVNTYRIFRVRAPGTESDVFRGTAANPGQFRCAMVLLAIITGFPALARKAIRILFQQPKDASWDDIVAAFRSSQVHEADFATDELAPTVREGRAEWLRMCEALADLGRDGAVPFSAGTFVSWTPWVARYSFSSVLPAYREAR